ncbi:MAG: hypothetical protein CM1200mP15_10940 [Dehalococcoidia bacterium]|nr:MAG: hypothetical protein CM1200mP15_10940 [Dehalococcoidia bacterium]
MPLPGDPWKYQSGESSRGTVRVPKEVVGGLPADTSYISVVDQWGNAFSGTPSDGIGGGPTVSGLGFVISPRGSQSWLDEEHPSCLAPGKRPRLTPTPSMAFRNGRLLMPFGTPGGDVQCQSMVQIFLERFRIWNECSAGDRSSKNIYMELSKFVLATCLSQEFNWY